MTPTQDPATRQSLKGMYIVLLVAGVLALGLHLYNFVRKPEPCLKELPIPLVVGGLMLSAWSGLLPAAKTRARRILMVLAFVCVLAGLVLVSLDIFRT